jgi:RNA methyltransferase, TrmH family
VDPYHPAVVRASIGALFTQRLVRASPAELAAWKRQHGVLLVGTSPAATTDYRSVSYQQPLVLCMGWERQGLSPRLQALCDVVVRIPMAGASDSILDHLFLDRSAGAGELGKVDRIAFRHESDVSDE